MYFYWQKSPTGKYIPMKSVGKPMTRSVNGQFYAIKHIVKLEPTEERMSLDELARMFSINEQE